MLLFSFISVYFKTKKATLFQIVINIFSSRKISFWVNKNAVYFLLIVLLPQEHVTFVKI